MFWMHSERLAVCFLHFLLRVLCGKSQIHDTLQWGKTARSPVFGACPAGVVRCRGAGYGLGQHFCVCWWLSGLQEGEGLAQEPAPVFAVAVERPSSGQAQETRAVQAAGRRLALL